MSVRALQRNSFAALALLGFLLPSLAFAAGSIDPAYSYAWGSVAGWVNLAPSNSPVTVSDTGLYGYAWSPNDGWINFAPAQGGVTNSGGTLGGFAWDAAVGWVSFSGVTIDASGRFHGQATGANDYTINFDCAKCDVRTSWRPSHAATSQTTSSPGAISPVWVPQSPQVTPTPVTTPELPVQVSNTATRQPSISTGNTGRPASSPTTTSSAPPPASTSSKAGLTGAVPPQANGTQAIRGQIASSSTKIGTSTQPTPSHWSRVRAFVAKHPIAVSAGFGGSLLFALALFLSL